MINKKVFGETKNKLIKINILVVSSFLIIFSLFTYFYFQEITYNKVMDKIKKEKYVVESEVVDNNNSIILTLNID